MRGWEHWVAGAPHRRSECQVVVHFPQLMIFRSVSYRQGLFLFVSMDFDHFLFALPGATRNTSNARKVHIRRLNDILQLCLQRNDALRSKRAWAILARCKEVSWMEMWTTAVHIL